MSFLVMLVSCGDAGTLDEDSEEPIDNKTALKAAVNTLNLNAMPQDTKISQLIAHRS